MGDEMKNKKHWEQVYTRKSLQEVSWFQSSPATSLQLIQKSGVDPREPVIDVGGGASTLVDGLLRLGYQDVSILDIAAAALAVAQTRLGERASCVNWLEADITKFHPDRQYALWHDRAVFHFLTSAESRRHYMAALHGALAPDGHVIIAAFAIGGPVKCSGLDIEQYDAEKMIGEFGTGFELLETVLENHLTSDGNAQAFNYFHFNRIA
ncbi:MAG: class I SAM-dependent methyltransferase [Moraxellaceae bacterium]|nr:class I SAM-dependent methyltransferase [Moraxellaceae bacterium]